MRNYYVMGGSGAWPGPTAPGTPVGHTKQPGPHTAKGPKRRSASGPHTRVCQLLTG